ncbi:BnaC02g17070D [Brassica napus]|uniref:(rape) hypothetical protein n=2 Tax=Brassica napus TaxID=3708 RepID=A0A078HUZ2_BRANA|nr:unnamed protein product [Brassica napus]CDY42330.1 BnaC02g17070D [Brassica napus]
MEDTISNPSMEPLLFSVDPMSLFLTQNNLCGFERGPRYREYATLREAKLRLKREYEKILKEEEERFFRGGKKQTRIGFTRQDEIKVSPAKKRFGFNYVPANPNPRRMSSSSSSLAQSVPDFSAMIRKENRRPANSNLLPRRTDLTPPPPSKSRTASVFSGSVSSIRGSISTSAGEKKSKGIINARKSYATVEDLKKISTAVASAINGGGRKSLGGGGGGGRRKSVSGGGGGRTILGYRQT